ACFMRQNPQTKPPFSYATPALFARPGKGGSGRDVGAETEEHGGVRRDAFIVQQVHGVILALVDLLAVGGAVITHLVGGAVDQAVVSLGHLEGDGLIAEAEHLHTVRRLPVPAHVLAVIQIVGDAVHLHGGGVIVGRVVGGAAGGQRAAGVQVI